MTSSKELAFGGVPEDPELHKRQFKKLRRQIRADIRKGKEIDSTRLNRLLELDDQLTQTDPTWHRNYEQSKKDN